MDTVTHDSNAPFSDDVGRLVRHLTLSAPGIQYRDAYRSYRGIFNSRKQWMSQMPNLESVTMEIDVPLVGPWDSLTESFQTLERLRNLTIINLGAAWPISQNVMNFLLHLFKAVGPKLQSLSLSLKSSLSLSALNSLRDSMENLKHLELIWSIGETVSIAFSQSCIWACGNNLTSLRAIDCQGIHATHIVQLVTQGTWKNLANLTLHFRSSISELDRISPPASGQWLLDNHALESFELRDISVFRLRHFPSIRTQELIINPTLVGVLLGLDNPASYIGLERVVVLAESHKRNPYRIKMDGLRSACIKRGVKLLVL